MTQIQIPGPHYWSAMRGLEEVIGQIEARSALAAGSRRAKTAQPVECEASQSGDAKQRNAQPLSDRIEQLNQGGSK